MKHASAKLVTQSQIAWTEEPLNILGIYVSDKEDVVMEKNFTPLLEKSKSILKSWENRDLSLFGKILVINTLVACQFVYKMSVLPNMSDEFIQKMNNIFIDYLWKG